MWTKLWILTVVHVCNVLSDAATDFNHVNKDGSFFFGLSNDDIGGHYHTATGSSNKVVRGRYGSRNSANGRIEETVYTAGPRGFRAQGPQIHRKMDLSQYPRGPIGSPDDPLADPYEDPSYSFKFKAADHERREDADSTGRVRGLYAYIDDIGERHTVRYAAGAGTGFEVINSVPDSPAIVNYNAPLYKAPLKTRGRMAVQRGPDGQYKFILSSPDQRRSESSGPDGIVRGSYSYLDDKGIQRTVQYIAGAGIGYRVVQSTTGAGTHLAPRPAIPEFGIRDRESNDLTDGGFYGAPGGRPRPTGIGTGGGVGGGGGVGSNFPDDDNDLPDFPSRPGTSTSGGGNRRPFGNKGTGSGGSTGDDDGSYRPDRYDGDKNSGTYRPSSPDRGKPSFGDRNRDRDRDRFGTGAGTGGGGGGSYGHGSGGGGYGGGSESGYDDGSYDDSKFGTGGGGGSKRPGVDRGDHKPGYNYEKGTGSGLGSGSVDNKKNNGYLPREDGRYPPHRGNKGTGSKGSSGGGSGYGGSGGGGHGGTYGGGSSSGGGNYGGGGSSGVGGGQSNYDDDYGNDFPTISNDRNRIEQDRNRDWRDRGRDSTIIKNVGKWYVGLPPGAVVRAHVQSIDLLPLGGRPPSPSEALRRDEVDDL